MEEKGQNGGQKSVPPKEEGREDFSPTWEDTTGPPWENTRRPSPEEEKGYK